MYRRIVALSLFAVAFVPALAGPAGAHQPRSCPRVVIFTLPGVTWATVASVSPPHLMSAIDDGAIGSLSVRTNASRTTYASGFASIGAGARVDGGRSSGYVEGALPDQGTASATAAGVEEMRALLDTAGYTTVAPGALAEALDGRPVAAIGNADLGLDPPTPLGRGRWSLLAAMDEAGHVDVAATGADLVMKTDAPYGIAGNEDAMREALEVLEVPCMTAVIDPGDTTRADAAATNRGLLEDPEAHTSLLRADAILGEVRARLHDHSDLLIIVAPTSPGWDPDVHFGVAVVVGKGFPQGSLLESPGTRRAGLVTLPDIAPTVLQHFGTTRPPSMIGRAMFAVTSENPDRMADQIHLDNESVFIDAMRAPVSSGFVIVQVLLYVVVALVLKARSAAGGSSSPTRLPEGFVLGALAVVAFPLATYLAGLTDQLAFGPWGFVGVLLAIDLGVVLAICAFLKDPFDRLLGVTLLTYVVLVIDLVTGANLQVNTVFSYSPLVAGRFAGIGNIAYSVLAAVTVISAALLVHRRNGSKRALAVSGMLFVIAVIVDAAPMFGSDVGGILALVPGLSITWMLLAGRRLQVRKVAFLLVGLLAAVGLFLALDLSQPEQSRTHLARLFEDVRARGPDVFADVVRRKIETNLRVFRSTIWTYLVPPALGLIAWLLLRPRNRWQRVAETYPRLRAGLVSCLVVAVLGFAVNDSGIVVPAMMLSFLVPMALVMHLSLDEEPP